MFINFDLIFIGLITYFIGSIPFGLLVSKFAKMELRWDYSIFVAIRRRSNEVMVSTLEGIVTVRDVRRIPDRRWGIDSLYWVRWAPWNRYKGAGDQEHSGGP